MKFVHILLMLTLIAFSCGDGNDVPEKYVELNSQIDQIKSATREHEDYQESIRELTSLLKESKREGYDYLTARTYSFIGYYFGQMNLNRKAYLAYKDALKYWEICDSSSVRSLYAINHNLANIASEHANYEQAIAHYEEALEYGKGLSNDDISDTYYSMGFMYTKMKTKKGYESAEKYYLQSLEYAQKDHIHDNVARIYYAIGVIYTDLEELDIAEASFNEAIRYSKKNRIDEYLECTYWGLGQLYLKNEMIEKSIDMLTAAVAFKIDDEITYKAWKDLGAAHLKAGNYQQALDSWESALAYKAEIVEPEVAEIYNQMALAYKKAGNTEKAFEYAAEYNSTIAELLTTRNMIEGSYEKVLFKDVISQYEEFQRKENFQQRIYDTYLPFSLVMIAFLLAVILYFKYQSRQKRKLTAEKIKSFQVD